MPIRALLFDLFATVVHFSAQAPIADVAGTRWVTMGWLEEVAVAKLPDLPFESLVSALMETTQEIVRARAPEYYEVPSSERFRRALAKRNIVGETAAAVAHELSRTHMGYLASTTFLPQGYGEVLEQLRKQYRLALVSNFDHAATARHVLETHGVSACFDAIVISEEIGRRKPHPFIYEHALGCLGVSTEEAVFIGDNPKEDIAGAQAAGLRTVWVCGDNDPSTVPSADFVVKDLKDLLTVMSRIT